MRSPGRRHRIGVDLFTGPPDTSIKRMTYLRDEGPAKRSIPPYGRRCRGAGKVEIWPLEQPIANPAERTSAHAAPASSPAERTTRAFHYLAGAPWGVGNPRPGLDLVGWSMAHPAFAGKARRGEQTAQPDRAQPGDQRTPADPLALVVVHGPPRCQVRSVRGPPISLLWLLMRSL